MAEKGRPPIYRPEFAEQARSYCLLGATNEKLAELFGVSISAIELWMRTREDFVRSVKEGREVADSQVAQSLFGKATSGDVTACIFWLKNRQPRQWREKHEVAIGDGEGGPAKVLVEFVESKG